MKSKLLLPQRFKMLGIILFIAFAIPGILYMYYNSRDPFSSAGKKGTLPEFLMHDISNEVILTGLIISLLLISFARVKNEDEFIHLIRLESWQWAVLINFLLLIVANWTLYELYFLDVMVYNMLTIPILFIIRFQYLLWRAKKTEAKNYAL